MENNLTKSTLRLLSKAEEHQDEYIPKTEAIFRQLANKAIIMFVGPVAVGKSTIMEKISSINHDYRLVTDFTTREPRTDDDPNKYRHIPHNEENVLNILKQIKNGELVQYMIHPSTGRIYGSTIDDYKSEYNLLDVMAGGVDSIAKLPFKFNRVFGVVAEPDVWINRLDSRYGPETESDEKIKRLGEAALSLNYLSQAKNIDWVNNTNPDIYKTSSDLIYCIENKKKTKDYQCLAQSMKDKLEK